MKRLILALALMTTINPAFAEYFVFDKEPENGDRPSKVVAESKDVPAESVGVDDALSAQSPLESDYVYQDGRVVYSPKQPGKPADMPTPEEAQAAMKSAWAQLKQGNAISAEGAAIIESFYPYLK